jgi:enoyl-CoA hydratase
MSSAAVTTERRDGVLIVHLDDGKANALSFDMIAAVDAALDEAEADDEIRAMVLHGRPGKFSAGFDLGVMLGDDMAAIIGLVADGGALVQRLYGSSLPVVAASTGHALAAGALLLLGCDVRVGADVEAKVGLNEVAIKMVLPDWALTIAIDRLSKRHLQRALANARITTPAMRSTSASSTRSCPRVENSIGPSPSLRNWRRRSTRRRTPAPCGRSAGRCSI